LGASRWKTASKPGGAGDDGADGPRLRPVGLTEAEVTALLQILLQAGLHVSKIAALRIADVGTAGTGGLRQSPAG